VQHKKFNLRYLIVEAAYWGYRMENLRSEESERFPLEEIHKDYEVVSEARV